MFCLVFSVDEILGLFNSTVFLVKFRPFRLFNHPNLIYFYSKHSTNSAALHIPIKSHIYLIHKIVDQPERKLRDYYPRLSLDNVSAQFHQTLMQKAGDGMLLD